MIAQMADIWAHNFCFKADPSRNSLYHPIVNLLYEETRYTPVNNALNSQELPLDWVYVILADIIKVFPTYYLLSIICHALLVEQAKHCPVENLLSVLLDSE